MSPPTQQPHTPLMPVVDMAATMERLQDYKTHNSQFCKRIFDFLSIMFIAQVKASVLRVSVVLTADVV